MMHPAENDARERIASWLLPELAHAQGVAEASAVIKRAREGRVDPEWEGLTADDMAAEAEVLGSLIETVRAALGIRVFPPAEDCPDMPCEDCEQGLSSCCVPPAETCVGPDLRRELNEALDWNANLVRRIEPVVARAIARAGGSRLP